MNSQSIMFAERCLPGHGLWGVLKEPPSNEVRDAFVRLLVEDVEPRSIVTLPDDLVDGVAVTDVGRGRTAWNSIGLKASQPDIDVAGVTVAGWGKVRGDICELKKEKMFLFFSSFRL